MSTRSIPSCHLVAGLLVVATALACAPPSSTRPRGLAQPSASPRIIGGDAYSGLPAVGALTLDGTPFCTGTVIAPRRVLTAAHCLADVEPWLLRFAIGPRAWEPERALGVSRLEPHPDYDPATLHADLGLVHLARDARVEPLPLVERLDASWVGVELQLVGYGMDVPASPERVGVKREVRLPLEQLTSRELWFGGYAANVCNGDSGGPALVDDGVGIAIAGVVSAGDAWCERFGIATRVDRYLDFARGEAVDPCQGETVQGRCDDDSLIWCEDDRIYRRDCREDGGVCAVGASGVADCVDEPCQGETWYGRCEGETLVWCEDEQVQRQDCRELDARCGLYDEAEGYYCLEE